jgi:hypothetical protein
MGAVIIVLAVIGLLVLLVYLKFPPPFANAKTIGVYNNMVLGVCGVLCLLWFLNARATWMGTDADQWWVALGVAGALGIEIGFLSIALLLRNFWIFKPPRRPGGL